jgi:hypothetical protein
MLQACAQIDLAVSGLQDVLQRLGQEWTAIVAIFSQVASTSHRLSRLPTPSDEGFGEPDPSDERCAGPVCVGS